MSLVLPACMCIRNDETNPINAYHDLPRTYVLKLASCEIFIVVVIVIVIMDQDCGSVVRTMVEFTLSLIIMDWYIKLKL